MCILRLEIQPPIFFPFYLWGGAGRRGGSHVLCNPYYLPPPHTLSFGSRPKQIVLHLLVVVDVYQFRCAQVECHTRLYFDLIYRLFHDFNKIYTLKNLNEQIREQGGMNQGVGWGVSCIMCKHFSLEYIISLHFRSNLLSPHSHFILANYMCMPLLPLVRQPQI